jgi:hypothetical protein
MNGSLYKVKEMCRNNATIFSQKKGSRKKVYFRFRRRATNYALFSLL